MDSEVKFILMSFVNSTRNSLSLLIFLSWINSNFVTSWTNKKQKTFFFSALTNSELLSYYKIWSFWRTATIKALIKYKIKKSLNILGQLVQRVFQNQLQIVLRYHRDLNVNIFGWHCNWFSKFPVVK